MQSLGPRNAITVILNEHEQLSTVIEGMRSFVRLAGSRYPRSGSHGVSGNALLHQGVP
jgi:hypothetical protein